MQRRLRLAAGLVAMVAAAACQSKQSNDDALTRELDSASGASGGLLPMNGGTDVVSAIERVTPPKKAPMVPDLGGKERTRIAVISPNPTVIEQVPQNILKDDGKVQVSVDTTKADVYVPAATVPRQESGDHFPSPAHHPESRRGTDRTQRGTDPPRRGGYPSTGDIIRNAPFPINP